MTLTTGSTLLGLAAVAAVAWSFGGTVGTGVFAGGLLAASVTLLGLAWQRHVIRTEPQRALSSFALGFVFKLVALGAGVALLRFVPPAGERADWQGFALGFVGLAVFVLVPGTFDNVRAQQNGAASSRDLDAPDLQGGRTL